MNKLTNKTFHYYESTLQSAQTNMDTDKHLCEVFKDTKVPILRLYSWQKSFTVGISQNCEQYMDLKKEFDNNCAKRITGGGVLFHGNDISYSIVIPTDYFELFNVKETYELICSFLFTFYESLGLKPKYAKDLDSIEISKSDFCQIGYEPYDIIINNQKIGGNAQRRTKHFIFQHGSIQVFPMGEDIMFGNSLVDFNIDLSLEDVKKLIKDAFVKTFDVKLENQV